MAHHPWPCRKKHHHHHSPSRLESAPRQGLGSLSRPDPDQSGELSFGSDTLHCTHCCWCIHISSSEVAPSAWRNPSCAFISSLLSRVSSLCQVSLFASIAPHYPPNPRFRKGASLSVTLAQVVQCDNHDYTLIAEHRRGRFLLIVANSSLTSLEPATQLQNPN